ncbi:MAG TPA: menaquinone biosynthesis protein [Acidobacteriaceae bacterium]|nr:menaquinone biosynthesis protein [Acidobacteriaceae bacterium]
MPSDRLRVSAIHFLNPAPLMWSFDHEPDRSRLAERYALSSDTPAECAAKLAAGETDIGLVPVAAYATTPSLAVIPGCTIASRDRVRSIILVIRHHDGVEGVGRVALDTASRTSATYTRILFSRFWQVQPAFLPHAPDLDAMLRVADAALLIGDPALYALEDREARQRRTGERLLYLDLAHEWHNFTGTVWVSAFWALRPESLASPPIRAGQIIEDFQRSREAGLAHIDDLADEWSARLHLPRTTVHTYLSQNIWYLLDDACLAGLDLFYRYGFECGALPLAPKLRFL